MSSLMGNLTLFSIIMAFLLVGARKRVPVYECFIEGAKEGFDIARNLLPYLVAMLCAIGVLRASGALVVALDAIRWVVHAAGLDARFVHPFPPPPYNPSPVPPPPPPP